jgi:uncharacterized damage-inducible protein DinB
MAIAEAILAEFDNEVTNTRKYIECVPNDKLDWSAHDKSYSLRDAITHLASLLTWMTSTINDDSYDIAKSSPADPAGSVAEALSTFDKNAEEARAALAGASDETMMGPWSLFHGEHAVFTLPRVAVVRSMVMNHMIHHRGQLSVYLRLNDVPLPMLYGPTADEQGG